jgi:cell pole-organizing protein PopZ
MAKAKLSDNQQMEAILASIRRMISDDDVVVPLNSGTKLNDALMSNVQRLFAEAADGPLEPEPKPESEAAAPDEAPVAVEPEAPAAANAVPYADDHAPSEEEMDIIAEAEQAERARAEAAAEAAMVAFEPVDERASNDAPSAQASAVTAREWPAAGLLSPRTDAVVSATFDQLASRMLSGGARTVDQLVEDLVRPMLKSWLDTNLPPLVERLVRDEIERVSRGRR